MGSSKTKSVLLDCAARRRGGRRELRGRSSAIEAVEPLAAPAGIVAPQSDVWFAAPTTLTNGHTDQPTTNLPFCAPYEKLYKRASRIESRMPEIGLEIVLLDPRRRR